MPDSTITLVIFFFVSLVLSLRAQFAVENKPINQLHGSGSREEAEQEISFFFPKQQTVAVIKPDAMEEHKGLFMTQKCLTLLLFWHIFHIFLLLILTEAILDEIRGRGFSVTRLKETVLSREMAEEFYKEHREKPFFNQLVEFMCRLVCSRIQPPEQCKVTAYPP